MEELKLDDLSITFDTQRFGPNSKNCWPGFDSKFYQPYNKNDKVGKICDFTAQTLQSNQIQTQPQNNKQQKDKSKKAQVKEIEHEDDDKDFTTVEQQIKVQSKDNQGQKGRQYQKGKRNYKTGAQNKYQQQNKQDQALNKNKSMPMQTMSKKRRQFNKNLYGANQVQNLYHWNRKVFRDPSVEIQSEWPILYEYTKQTLEKLPPIKVKFLGSEVRAGEIHQYNTDIDKSRAVKPVNLPAFSGDVFNQDTLSDPVIERLAKEGKANIFTTDVVAATLMTASKSVFSWDVIIKKFQNTIFIDKRDKKNILDVQTVGETQTVDQPVDDDTIDGVKSLMKEAMDINKSWINFCQKPGQKEELDEKDPFIEDENQIAARMGYVYNIYDIDGTGKMKICIRCSVHSYTQPMGGIKIYQNVYAFNEYNPNKTMWSKEIDMGLVNCMNNEIQGNSCKVSRWVMQSVLAKVDQIKLAFVTRKNIKDNTKHIILGTYQVETLSWAKQLNIDIKNCWNVLKFIINIVQNREEQMGEYLFYKDPNKQSFQIYKFSSEDVDDSEESDEDDE